MVHDVVEVEGDDEAIVREIAKVYSTFHSRNAKSKRRLKEARERLIAAYLAFKADASKGNERVYDLAVNGYLCAEG